MRKFFVPVLMCLAMMSVLVSCKNDSNEPIDTKCVENMSAYIGMRRGEAIKKFDKEIGPCVELTYLLSYTTKTKMVNMSITDSIVSAVSYQRMNMMESRAKVDEMVELLSTDVESYYSKKGWDYSRGILVYNDEASDTLTTHKAFINRYNERKNDVKMMKELWSQGYWRIDYTSSDSNAFCFDLETKRRY